MKTRVVIGLEMHCELKSHAKVFSKGINAFSDTANTNVSPVDMAFPGTLPIVNKKCVEHAIQMAHILGCEIADEMIFDRKNYYYPDLPKGYQITQCTKPVGVNGIFKVPYQDRLLEVSIHDIHLEEDSAGLDHLFDTSTIDYNRAGVPLLEVVTNPCFYSAEEAVAFLEYIRSCYRYMDISEADLKKGQIRCDVNVNLQDEETNTYVTPRVEVKNVNGFAHVKEAIEYEEHRQRKALENGRVNELVQETRRFDEDTCTTITMRTKEDALDYKYFIDPNIPPYVISKEWVSELVNKIPKLPLERSKDYETLGLSNYDIENLLKEKETADYFEECIQLGVNPKEASNWITSMIMGILNKENTSIKDFFITPNYLKEILDAVKVGTLSSKQAKEVFTKSLEEHKEPKNFISKDNGQISDESYLKDLIHSLVESHQEQKQAYLNGRTNLFDFFVGQVMKETRGKANPVLTKELLKKELES